MIRLHPDYTVAEAAAQLREELERMRLALEEANARADRAEKEAAYWMQVAEEWREDAEQAIAETGGEPGITRDGHLVSQYPTQQAEPAIEMTLVRHPPSFEDGFRHLCIVRNSFSNTYEYRIIDFKSGRWIRGKNENFKDLPKSLQVLGWFKLPAPDNWGVICGQESA